jgi:uncharacterized protein (DUF885 family)
LLGLEGGQFRLEFIESGMSGLPLVAFGLQRPLTRVSQTDIAPPLLECQAMIAPPGGAAAMYYTSPSEDFSRPGRTWYPTLGKTRFPLWREVSICYHEGVPGHHFQIALAQELEGLPMFRKFGGYGAYTEGWALYAERLAREMGFYQDPMRDFGRLQDEIWRSVRLVTDTGIHAKRWTRQQAIDYFTANTPISEGDIVTEVERYFVNPGQALGYKMGMIQSLALRQRAEAAMGAAFDIRQFHDAVIGAGALPLPVLERQVDRYIAPFLGSS